MPKGIIHHAGPTDKQLMRDLQRAAEKAYGIKFKTRRVSMKRLKQMVFGKDA